MKYPCPICGFPKLNEPPRSASGGGSFEICPSCGFQFGVSDDDAGFTYQQWRTNWQLAGMKWTGQSPAPKKWDAAAQLKSLNRPISPKKRG
jgi:hypothetical protein